MNPVRILLENPVPIVTIGTIVGAFYGLAFLMRRNLSTLVALVVVVLATLGLALLEKLVVTDREQLELAVADLMVAIEQNDLPAVLTLIDPSAGTVRADAERVMPLVDVADTGATSLIVDVEDSSEDSGEPLRAESEFLGRIDGVHKPSGQRIFYFDKVLVQWVQRDGVWLVKSYQAMWNGRKIKTLKSVRIGRPSPLD